MNLSITRQWVGKHDPAATGCGNLYKFLRGPRRHAPQEQSSAPICDGGSDLNQFLSWAAPAPELHSATRCSDLNEFLRQSSFEHANSPISDPASGGVGATDGGGQLCPAAFKETLWHGVGATQFHQRRNLESGDGLNLAHPQLRLRPPASEPRASGRPPQGEGERQSPRGSKRRAARYPAFDSIKDAKSC